MDMLVAPLEDHVMILGLHFLKLAKEAPLIHESFLVFLEKAKMPSATLMMKRKIMRTPRIYVNRLVEGVGGRTNKPFNMAQ
jgi:hypothetical protein